MLPINLYDYFGFIVDKTYKPDNFLSSLDDRIGKSLLKNRIKLRAYFDAKKM